MSLKETFYAAAPFYAVLLLVVYSARVNWLLLGLMKMNWPLVTNEALNRHLKRQNRKCRSLVSLSTAILIAIFLVMGWRPGLAGIFLWFVGPIVLHPFARRSAASLYKRREDELDALIQQ